jgi:hypothetical protein
MNWLNRLKDKKREKIEVQRNACKSRELYQFLLSKLGSNGWTYSSLDKDGVRFRKDNPFICLSENQDLHGSLEKIRKFMIEEKSCYLSYTNPDGFCGDCYFGYFETMDNGVGANCSLDLTVEKLTQGNCNTDETRVVKYGIAEEYHKQLSGKQPAYSQSLIILKNILYKLWKTGNIR